MFAGLQPPATMGSCWIMATVHHLHIPKVDEVKVLYLSLLLLSSQFLRSGCSCTLHCHFNRVRARGFWFDLSLANVAYPPVKDPCTEPRIWTKALLLCCCYLFLAAFVCDTNSFGCINLKFDHCYIEVSRSSTR